MSVQKGIYAHLLVHSFPHSDTRTTLLAGQCAFCRYFLHMAISRLGLVFDHAPVLACTCLVAVILLRLILGWHVTFAGTARFFMGTIHGKLASG